MKDYTFGIKELDDEIEGIKRGSNILMIGPPMCGKEYILYHIMYHGAAINQNSIINVTTRETAAHILDWFKENKLNLPVNKIGMIDCVTKIHHNAQNIENIKIASSPVDLPGIGVHISHFFDEFFMKQQNQKNQLHINSLSTIWMYSNTQTVVSFLHIYTKRVKAIGALGIFLMDGGMHDEHDIAIIKQLFDGIIEIKSENDKNLIRIVGLSPKPTSWYEYVIEGSKLEILGKLSPSVLNTPNLKLLPLSRKAKFFMARSEIPECKPLNDAISSAGQIFYKFTANEKLDFDHLNTEYKIFDTIINISDYDFKHIMTVREQTNLISKLKYVRDNFHLLENATFLTSFGEYQSRRKSILASITTIKNACNWGISGLNSDHDKLVDSINETLKEIEILKEITNKSYSKSEDDGIQNKQHINKEIFRYISGKPNEGKTKINLGPEEILSITNSYCDYISENGKKYSFDLVKTRSENGNRRYIFKIGLVYVAGILIDKNNNVIASHVESYLNEVDIIDKLSSAIFKDSEFQRIKGA